MENRHEELRNKLETLGYGHSLPLSAIGLVSAILNDLIKTAEDLKSARLEINQLLQVYHSWHLVFSIT